MNRVPAATVFERLSLDEQSMRIRKVQDEIDELAEGVRSGRISPNHRGRGCALRDLRARQRRLDRLASTFGYQRVWRKHIRAKAISRPSEA
jgi:hypothetical protein